MTPLQAQLQVLALVTTRRGVPVVVTFGDQMSQRVSAAAAATTAAAVTAAAAAVSAVSAVMTEEGELRPGSMLTAGIYAIY
jgi:D-aminopeptidase